MKVPTNQELRRALEALRNGVPNRDAVRFLGCTQAEVTDRYRAQLQEIDSARREARQVPGMLVAGGFGSGKSHLLEYLKHLAVEQNLVCSLVVISKETPLYDAAKVYAAAVESAVVPGLTGQAIHEIALRLRQDSPRYAEFFQWSTSENSGISPVFPATLLLHERLANDPDMLEQIRGFWAGGKLPIADIRAGMKQIGQVGTFQLRPVPTREIARQRFRFASQLIAGAGYRGWILLIDEVELVGRYSLLQRSKSYAELARWMGHVETEQLPGLTVVAAITDDFTLNVLQEKGDRLNVGARLHSRDAEEYRVLAGRAEAGMRTIEREAVTLRPPDTEMLEQTYETLKRIHGQAYGWDPPDVPSAARALRRAMRSYVRRWINEWDLRRLYPGEALETVETELKIGYAEAPELEQTTADDDPDD